MSQLLEGLRSALAERYYVECEVGRGGMATVFAADDLKLGRRVAIKVLSPELSSSLDSERFRQEIQIAARLNHPHILPVFESGDAGGLLYYVMPFVEGESLRGRLNRETQLAIEDAIAIACEVADALSYAHAFGVVHRDIKPENILIHGGHAVVADFGIARVIQDAGGEKLTKTGMSIGTAAYMSPEQFSGTNVDGRSDMYSLACVVYEMLVGEVPFTGPNAVAIMARHTMEAPPSIQIVRSTVGDELEGAVMRALEKVPADRFATVAQFKEALLGQGVTSTYVRRTRAHTRQTTARVVEEAPVSRRRRTLLYGAAAMVFLAAGSLAARYYWWTDHASAAAASDVRLRRIAVRYFEDATPDSSLRHVADGLTETLIGQLSQVEGLDVVSSGGVAPFRGTDVPDDSIGRVLKAGLLVHGSIDDERDKVRVSLALVDGQSGAAMSRQSFRVLKSELLNAMDSVSTVVAELLRRRLGEEVRLREQRSRTSSADAWALVQRVENVRKDVERLVAAGDPPGALRRLAEADSLAARAAELDDRWTEPLVQRSAIALRRARLSRDPVEAKAAIAAGYEQAERALTLDPRDAAALEMRGSLKYYPVLRGFVPDENTRKNVVAEAERDLRSAVDIAPRQATAWNTLSILQYDKQNVVESNLAARRAYEADAFLRAAPDILWRLYATSYDLEQFEDAKHWCDEAERRFASDRRFVLCRLQLMSTKAVTPDPQTAWQTLGDLERVTPKQEWEYQRRVGQMWVAVVLARAGLADSAHRVIERSRAGRDIDARGELMGYEALVYTFLGEREKAVTQLERYLTGYPEHRAGFAKVNAWWWRSLQQDPRFRTLAGTGR